MKSILALSILLVGCSVGSHSIKQDGMQYEYHAYSCAAVPEWAAKYKEDLKDKKVCFRAGAGVVILPADFDESKL